MAKRKGGSKATGFEPQEQPAPKRRRRAYEGAMVSRLTSDWVTSSTSADAEIDGSLIRLRKGSYNSHKW